MHAYIVDNTVGAFELEVSVNPSQKTEEIKSDLLNK